MTKFLLKTFGFFLFAGACYLPHRFFVLPYFPDVPVAFLNFSYLYNFSATILAVLAIFFVAKSSKDFLGFLFMGFGTFKLIFFVLVSSQLGIDLGPNLFLHFFLPYVLCVAIEMFFVIQILKEDKPENINKLD